MKGDVFTSRIIKGGALLADSRRFLEAWDPDLTAAQNLARIRAHGALGKTRVREDAVLAILRRRFADAGPAVIDTVRRLTHDPGAFREACYYEASMVDTLLAAFVEGPVFEWYAAGRREVSATDVVRWLSTDRRTPQWNDATKTRVAQGLLATLRDFGVLEGAVGGQRKRIAAPHLSARGFGYVAFRERHRHVSDRSLVESPVWKRFLLTSDAVRCLFLEADRLGILRFAEAGSLVRVDWLVDRLEEVLGVVPA